MNDDKGTAPVGVKQVDDPLWSVTVDRFAEAFDAFMQAMSDAEAHARTSADGYSADGRIVLAGNSRGAADAYAVAQRTARIAFRPFIGGMLVDAVADSLDEDRCEATDAF